MNHGERKLRNKVNVGLITLIFKFADINKLIDWRLITLLNVTYKIIVKVLQLWLQLHPMEIINNGQTTILPSILILENMFLANETIH
jgi:hypothetical protein